MEQLYPGQNLYNYVHLYEITGDIDVCRLQLAFKNVIGRHEILKSTYHMVDGAPVQKVRDDLQVEWIDVRSSIETPDNIATRDDHKANFINRGFNLQNELPIRFLFIELAEGHYELLIALHHIAGDAWSLNIINQEVTAYYRNSTPIGQAPLHFQYQDYSYWQNQNVHSIDDLNYWKSKLTNETPTIEVLQSRPGAQQIFSGKHDVFTLPNELSTKLKSLASELNMTTFTLLLAAFKVLLYKYSGHKLSLIHI